MTKRQIAYAKNYRKQGWTLNAIAKRMEVPYGELHNALTGRPMVVEGPERRKQRYERKSLKEQKAALLAEKPGDVEHARIVAAVFG